MEESESEEESESNDGTRFDNSGFGLFEKLVHVANAYVHGVIDNAADPNGKVQSTITIVVPPGNAGVANGEFEGERELEPLEGTKGNGATLELLKLPLLSSMEEPQLRLFHEVHMGSMDSTIGM
ncbi:hypothetical protein Scep_019411 [Stephania cephalantha]|uniref:Uncharacterized protein n=1 Tax=Stephania cephalantha TaxID=152367 RepID=A0AAP0NLB6_9MAGN